MGQAVQWYDTVFELIDMRSFSNLWFWIVLAVLWSTMSHYVLGVPFDMVTRARKIGGQAQIDLEDMVRINVNRRLYISRVSGMWLVAISSAALTALAILGFFYRVQFAQAVFLLFAPVTIVGAMGLRAAARIEAEAPSGDTLCKRLTTHRFQIQLVGIAAIFVTAMWGMWQNMNVGAFR
jgi:hypothetical protein